MGVGSVRPTPSFQFGFCGDSQRDSMILSIALDKQIQCETVCKTVQELVNKFISEGGELKESLLTMTIKTTVDSIGDSPLLKIEHKES